MTYQERLKIYKEEYDIGGYGIFGRDKFKLLSLLCILTKAARKKTPEILPLNVLQKTIDDKTCANMSVFVPLSIQCDALLDSPKEAQFDNYGLVKASDMLAEVKRILDEWLPF